MVLSADQRAVVLRLTGRDIVAMVGWWLGIPIAVVGYAAVLGARSGRLSVYGVVLAAVLVLRCLVALAAAWVAAFGPHPAITGDGFLIRTRLLSPRPTLAPWSQVHHAWIDSPWGNRTLAVLPRLESRPRFIPLPRHSPGIDELRDLVGTLSAGAVRVADRAPHPGDFGTEGGRPVGRFRRPFTRTVPIWMLAVVVVVNAVLVPLAVSVPQPWNQPWMPGVDVAIQAPDPCAAVRPEALRTLGGTAPGRITADGAGVRECTFTIANGDLVVRSSVYHAFFGGSADKAHNHLYDVRPAETRRLGGLGDEAWIVGNEPGSAASLKRAVVGLIARRANVIVEVVYSGDVSAAVGRSAVTEIASRALSSARVD